MDGGRRVVGVMRGGVECVGGGWWVRVVVVVGVGRADRGWGGGGGEASTATKM